jgi:periplasmic protein TonB
MTAYASEQDDRFASGLTGAVVLHLLLAAVLIGAAYVTHRSSDHWGEKASQVGAIQASMVSAIPLPSKAKPVDKSVLAPDDVSPAPVPPPKEAAIPPPRDTDILVKGKTQPAKTAPVPAVTPPKHPQPTPDTTKAQSGESATQLPQSITQVQNGTASLTVENKTFGARYAYYIRIVSDKVNQSFAQQEIDARSSQGKHVALLFDIEADGTVANLRTETRSGSASLDTAATRAIQRIDGFGPLPAGDHIVIEYTFDYHQ